MSVIAIVEPLLCQACPAHGVDCPYKSLSLDTETAARPHCRNKREGGRRRPKELATAELLRNRGWQPSQSSFSCY